MKLVATLACRNNSNRLYGKPLQRLAKLSVLEYIVRNLKERPEIDDIVLAISEAPGNEAYVPLAKKMGVSYVLGDDNDVLQRLITAAKSVGGDTVFRMTTESPFPYLEGLAEAKESHRSLDADYTTLAKLPDGSSFELLKLAALEKAHAQGKEKHRSELCTLYINENRDQFRLNVMQVPEKFQRADYRLTIDFPEDLILCRKIIMHLGEEGYLPFEKLTPFLDERADLRRLVENLTDEKYIKPYF